MKIEEKFYQEDSIDLAKNLLGKILVKNENGKILKARIVETEAYAGENDRACHTYGGKRTKRTEVMYKKGGHLYIYLIYGMYNMLNIVSGKEGSGQAVLIRGVEPISKLDDFSKNRFNKNYRDLSSYQKKNLTNGPGKVCSALNISKTDNGVYLLDDYIYLEDDGYSDFEIVKSKRIGIDYAGDDKDLLYRFFLKDNKYVSSK